MGAFERQDSEMEKLLMNGPNTLDVLITMGVPVALATILLIGFVQLLRLLGAWMMHRTLRRALSGDQSVALALVERLDGARREPADDRNGLVLVALGLAIAGFGLIQGGEANIRAALGAALFPLLVGAALLARFVMLKQRRGAETAVGE